MHLQFTHIEPHFLLKKYIDKMWIFESSGKMPEEDMKLVIPNGNLKLTLSYQNGIVADLNGKTFYSNPHDITLTGLVDVPVILDAKDNALTETIGIEFNPQGAYRFFHFNLNEIQNQIYSVCDLLGTKGKRLLLQIHETSFAEKKIMMLQQFLLSELSLKQEDLIFDFCIRNIIASKGKISIKELEKKTGYSSRWLNVKFNNNLGVSAKNLCSIIRFKECFKTFMNAANKAFLKRDFYDMYYDQSHFIKDFKRFTGLPPTRFEKQVNDFGEKYFRN
ncbi:AraC family transcriptional regulator [Hanamia caeni]|jgi:AraC-like DNA-binding protein|uniref:AraC family transcriptional regulator n=1 Tax=Hanamia caeni TaxID=2294116 RepID=A0A3M9NAW4_9BACT|nr:helix-turn-helix domain-containing protein [Hanamia caeni]RNI34924.1 AraC family transcriptional regulator [Hanamia caeni]